MSLVICKFDAVSGAFETLYFHFRQTNMKRQSDVTVSRGGLPSSDDKLAAVVFRRKYATFRSLLPMALPGSISSKGSWVSTL